ncbi:MAG: glycosyltransferase family 2 protein [Elusimicrobia bacterium]|nr:glycosyltransferase family 2 protein [Elusimicrobiota bacterium]
MKDASPRRQGSGLPDEESLRPPLVTVYIPTHNYGRFVERAIKSVFRQTMKDWELIVIDDGSTDDTADILKRYEDHPKVRVLHQTKKGLNVSNNIALRLANTPYVMRLDADDFLDENALLVMAQVLTTKPDVGLVYPDYYLVDDQGEVLEFVRRKKIGSEAKLLDLPAHGACTMIRKECLLELGGYSEEFSCQDGYDLWLRFLRTFKPYNVNVPLFYYTQHEGSLTRDGRRILETRAAINRGFVRRHKDGAAPKVLAIIPAAKRPPGTPDHAFSLVAGKPLLWHALTQALKARTLDRVAVATDDPEVVRYCRAPAWRKAAVIERPSRLAGAGSHIAPTVIYTLKELLAKRRYRPEAVMLLYLNSPLRRALHIDMAVDTLTIFDVDSVVSVTEELAYCYHHGAGGLTPIRRSRDLQIEKKAIFKENGAVLLTRTRAIDRRNFVGRRVGHILMLPEESIRVKTAFDLWMADRIASDWLPRSAARSRSTAR